MQKLAAMIIKVIQIKKLLRTTNFVAQRVDYLAIAARK